MSNVPKLRFKEFSGEWEEQVFKELFERITTKNKENNLNVLTISAQQGLINQEEYFNKSVSSKDLTGYYLLNKNDFAYNKSYSKGYPLGAIKRLNRYEKGVVSTLYICFRAKKDSVDFIEQYFNSGLMNKEIHKIAQEGARNHGLLNISVTEFFNDTKLILPSKPEQEKIASFLTSIDTKIEQLTKKEELLQQYKKGVMQKIFNQEIRFKKDDGSEFCDWEEKELGDLCKVAKSGGTPTSTNQEYYDGDIPFLSISDITSQGKYLKNTTKTISQKGIDNSSSWIVPENTIIYSMYASVGFVSINKIPLATSQAVINLILKDEADTEFIYYYLLDYKKYIHRFIETGTQGNLNAQTVKSLNINLPCLEEQTKIANFLSSIDSKIEQVQKQLNSTKEFKKALLQQMFI